MVDLVEQALREQRQVWRGWVEALPQSHLSQELPSMLPKRIILFGVGSSYFAARLTGFTLLREMSQRKSLQKIEVVACSSLAIGVEIHPSKGDWVFAFSHRGKTSVTLRALELSQSQGAFTVMVAAKGVASFEIGDLYLPTCEVEKCEPHTVGMTSAICAVSSLLLGGPTLERWHRLAEESNPDLDLIRSTVLQPSLILGEWEGEWIAREIALKLIEMAGVRVVAHGSEEYFHGPQLFSKQTGFRETIWYIGSDLDLSRNKISSLCSLRSDFDPSQSLSWVRSLVELQWAVLALALNRGVQPDFGV